MRCFSMSAKRLHLNQINVSKTILVAWRPISAQYNHQGTQLRLKGPLKSSAFGVLWRRQEQKGKDDVRVNHNTQTISKRLIRYLKLISNTSPSKCMHSVCHFLSATLHIQTVNKDIWPNKMESSSKRDAGLSVFGSCLSYKTRISSIVFSAMHELSHPKRSTFYGYHTLTL